MRGLMQKGWKDEGLVLHRGDVSGASCGTVP